MRNTLDSFMQLLATELPSIPFHAFGFDTDFPDNEDLKLEAVNISFVDAYFHNHISVLTVSLDLCYKNELTGLAISQQIFDLLNKRYMTEKYDYTNPASPVATGSMIYWERDAITFKRIPNDSYFHYNCTFDLKHHIVF